MSRKKKLKKELKKRMQAEKERKIMVYSKNNLSMVMLHVNKKTQNPIVFISILKYMVGKLKLWNREDGCVSTHETNAESRGFKIGTLMLLVENVIESPLYVHGAYQKPPIGFKDSKDVRGDAVALINKFIKQRYGENKDIYDMDRIDGNFCIQQLKDKSRDEATQILVDILESAAGTLAVQEVKLDEFSADIRYVDEDPDPFSRGCL